MTGDDDFKAMEPIKDAPVTTTTTIAALALNLALKYHSMNTVSDGVLYQQYKMEGKNMRELGLSDVFETAIQMEAHLLGGDARIAKLVVDALVDDVNVDAAMREAGLGEDEEPAPFSAGRMA